MLKKMNSALGSSKLKAVIRFFSSKLTFSTVHILEIKTLLTSLEYLTYTKKNFFPKTADYRCRYATHKVVVLLEIIKKNYYNFSTSLEKL